MGRIQSQFGLITGTDIQGTVDQLLKISGRPKDRLVSRTSVLQQEQTAITELTVSVIGVQLAGNRLADASFFRRKSAESSNEEILSAKAGAAAAAGTYTVRTINSAATHRVESAVQFDSVDEALGLSGSFELSPTGFLDQSSKLSGLNNGRGIQSGSFRITDRNGKSDVVEIKNARSIEDVLTAINDANVDVQATTQDGAIKLIDTSNGTTSNLILEQLGNSETLADLGLFGVDENQNTVVGAKLVDANSASTKLGSLGNGKGVRFNNGNDLRISLSDGTSLDVDFGDFSTAGPPATPAIGKPTLGDVVAFLNSQHGTKISASFDAGEIKITDLTTGTGSFSITNATGASTASDLGLAKAATGTTITSKLPTSSLRGTALSQLGGGSGLGALTTLNITTSKSSTVNVDLSTATTTSEVVDAINAAGGDVVARLNDAKTGFRLRDVSGGTGNFVVSSSDATASRLGIAANTSDDIIVGSPLKKQTVDLGTRLSDLNGGRGIDNGSFTITDSSGTVGAINLGVTSVKTVGDLIKNINDLSTNVTASLSPDGDGIAIVDNAGGTGTLKIQDTGDGTTAADLGLSGTASSVTINGTSVSAIVGGEQSSIEIENTDTLSSIVEKINSSGRYGKASIESADDGTYRLIVAANEGGESGRFTFNTSGFDFGLRTTSEGQDALIAYSVDGGSESFLTSSDGVFEIEGAVGSAESLVITEATTLASLAPSATAGSFTIEDSLGKKSAINLKVEGITTAGQLVDRINELGLNLTASITEDGSKIAIVSNDIDGEIKITDVGNSKVASALGIAGESTKITLNDVSVQALAGRGSKADASGSGLSLTVKGLSEENITITVSGDNKGITGAAKTFTDQYNKLVEKIDSLTFFNAEEDSVGLLFGSSEALRISTSYKTLLSGSINGAGDIKSLGSLGFSFDDKGKLSLSESKMSDALDANRDSVEAFFATKDTGIADRLSDLADRLAGTGNSLLLTRRETLQSQVERNNERVEALNKRLEKERERLLENFYKTEEAISKIQSNQNAVSSIQYIKPVTRS
jgi:flagellar hook-associated protein 2